MNKSVSAVILFVCSYGYAHKDISVYIWVIYVHTFSQLAVFMHLLAF